MNLFPHHIRDAKAAVNLIVVAICTALFASNWVQASAYQQQLEPNIVPVDQTSCSIDVNQEGSGSVTVTFEDGRSTTFDKTFRQVQTPCGETVTLSARPLGPSHFDHWEGVASNDSLTSTIEVTTPVAVKVVFKHRETYEEPLAVPFVDRSGEPVTTITRFLPLSDSLAENGRNATSVPEITVWYGDTQDFGQNGTPQQWLNILGNISDYDDPNLSLSYRLNGGTPRTLSYGGDGESVADGLRLWSPGDFNIDIDTDDPTLLSIPDSNEIVITATDLISTDVYTVSVNYDPDPFWPIPYAIDWSNAASVQDVAQITDGKWELSSDGVQPLETGYDRAIALGEGSFNEAGWTEFEATVPVTIHSYSDDGFGANQSAPWVGFVIRWQGNTDIPFVCEQPKCGYKPIGMASMYEWDKSDKSKATFKLANFSGSATEDTSGLQLTLDKIHLWKVRVDNKDSLKGTYYLKVWDPLIESEPADWLITRSGSGNGLTSGSLLIVSHHVEVTFGDLEICPLDGCADDVAPQISNIAADAKSQEATISWKTNEPASSRVDFWITTNEVQTVSDRNLVTIHGMTLQNLEPGTTYEYKVYSEDGSGNESEGPIETFTTSSDTMSPLISNVLVQPDAKDASVSWDTDEPATSRVEYWIDPANVMMDSDPTLSTTHEILLQNLQSNTTYAYRIFSTDQYGNEANTEISDFTTDADPNATYTLTIESVPVGLGTVSVAPEQASYRAGQQVTLTANPTWPKWYFDGWGLDADGNKNPLTIVMTKDTQVRATFKRYEFSYLPVVAWQN